MTADQTESLIIFPEVPINRKRTSLELYRLSPSSIGLLGTAEENQAQGNLESLPERLQSGNNSHPIKTICFVESTS